MQLLLIHIFPLIIRISRLVEILQNKSNFNGYLNLKYFIQKLQRCRCKRAPSSALGTFCEKVKLLPCTHIYTHAHMHTYTHTYESEDIKALFPVICKCVNVPHSLGGFSKRCGP